MAVNEIDISIVSPVFAAEECLGELCSRIVAVLEKTGLTFEIVLVEDGGPDNSWQMIQEIAEQDPRVRGLQLSRNFGQHYAITAGLAESRGEHVIVMDCDLQDPPEEIPKLFEKSRQGFEVVFVRRLSRKDSRFKRGTALVYSQILSLFTGVQIDGAQGTFSLLNRRAVNAFLRVGQQHRHYLAVLRWIGFRSTTIALPHQPRYAGKSSYGLRKLVDHAIVGITSQSVRLLHFSTYLGLGFVAAAIVTIFYLVYNKLTAGTAVDGWTSLMVLLLFTGGSILFSLGVLGLYVGRIFEQSKQMPLFLIREKTY